MEARLQGLHLDSKLLQTKKPAKAEVAESWEDEELDSDSDTQTPVEAPGPSLKHVMSNDAGTHAPPPTPISPQQHSYDFVAPTLVDDSRAQPVKSYGADTQRSESDTERRRPEKSTAAAGRMIAASLGMKVPKKTEEQRRYDRAMKEQEIKRRNREKEKQELERQEEKKAEAAMWED